MALQNCDQLLQFCHSFSPRTTEYRVLHASSTSRTLSVVHAEAQIFINGTDTQPQLINSGVVPPHTRALRSKPLVIFPNPHTKTHSNNLTYPDQIEEHHLINGVEEGLCGWRDVVAGAEDESTGYVLPYKTLLEIAKQMPVTSSKLCRLVNSKHPYVERNLGSVVSIIRHSMQNAAAFEAAVEHLKELRMQKGCEEIMAPADGNESIPSESPVRLEAVAAA